MVAAKLVSFAVTTNYLRSTRNGRAVLHDINSWGFPWQGDHYAAKERDHHYEVQLL